MINFNTANGRRALAFEPEIKPFLLMVLKDQHLSRIKVTFTSGASSSGSHKRLALSLVGRRHVLARRDYAAVDRYLTKRGLDYRKYYDWQWVILHEVTHAICGKKGSLHYQGKKKKAQKSRLYKIPFLVGSPSRVKKIKANPHGPTFRRVLLRLGRKYEKYAPIVELSLTKSQI